MSQTNGVLVYEMTPQRLLELAGTRREITRLFARRKRPISSQAVSKWFKAGKIPPARLLQLTRLKPDWFRVES